MTDEVDLFAPSEMNVEGAYMSAEYMANLQAAWMQGCWFWHDDYCALLYRSLEYRTAAPNF